MMILMMLIVIVGVLVGVGLLGSTLAGGRLLPPWTTSEDSRLLEQAERIEMLETELRRVQDQADFTERLLAERGGTRPDEDRASGAGAVVRRARRGYDEVKPG